MGDAYTPNEAWATFQGGKRRESSSWDSPTPDKVPSSAPTNFTTTASKAPTSPAIPPLQNRSVPTEDPEILASKQQIAEMQRKIELLELEKIKMDKARHLEELEKSRHPKKPEKPKKEKKKHHKKKSYSSSSDDSLSSTSESTSSEEDSPRKSKHSHKRHESKHDKAKKKYSSSDEDEEERQSRSKKEKYREGGRSKHDYHYDSKSKDYRSRRDEAPRRRPHEEPTRRLPENPSNQRNEPVRGATRPRRNPPPESDTVLRLKEDSDKLENDIKNLQKKNASPAEIKKLTQRREQTQTQLLLKQHAVDMCFLMDVTGSMGSWITATIQKIEEVVTKLKQKEGPHFSIRVAFVGYRDFEDQDRFQIFEFNNDPAQLKNWLSANVRATGGGDAPEDIHGGLQQVLSLDWQAQTRVVLHFADAPCHGRDYHNCSDSHPNAPSTDGRPEDVLLQLKDMDIDYYFVRLTGETDKMIQIFQSKWGRGEHKFKQININGQVGEFLPTVMQSVQQSLQATLSRPIPGSSAFFRTMT